MDNLDKIWYIFQMAMFVFYVHYLTLNRNLYKKHSLGTSSHVNSNESYRGYFFQTCEIKAEGGKRFLTLHKVKLDQAGEVLYQACNAVTTAILTVKGTGL